MNKIIEIEKWLVLPPKCDSDKVKDFLISVSDVADTQTEAWDKFTHPSLRREGYEAEGFKAVKVIITVEIK